MIVYNENKKNLPCDRLHRLFMSAGWSDDCSEMPGLLKNFNKPFINSTLVVSAWENERLVGAVRVLSDKIIRSIIYDLIVDPEYQNRGIGKELVKRCLKSFPDSEWLVCTTHDKTGYYVKLGFQVDNGCFLTIPSKWQNRLPLYKP